jgi:hypothetical protein
LVLKPIDGLGEKAEIWQKVWELISKPGRLLKAIDARIAQLQGRQYDAEAESLELQRPIEDVLAKRQGIINWALESEIAGADMALKLETLDAQREELVATWESNFY